MPTLTIAEMTKKMLAIGLKRKYKPVNDQDNIEREPGDEVILLESRKPVKIVDGYLSGSEADIYNDHIIRVWTSQKSKAMAIARANGFKVRLLDGEAELYIPVERADEFLHGLGIKVRATRTITAEQRSGLLARLAKARQAKKEALAVPA